MAAVVIGHGYKNERPADHWQHRLATALRDSGHRVFYPQFPKPEAPIAAEWQQVLLEQVDEAASISGESDELIYIGHSLGSVNWILAAGQAKFSRAFDRVLLVAPADPALLAMIPGYQLELQDADFVANVRAASSSITLLGSEADPWSPKGIQLTFGDPLNLEAQIVTGAKHFSRDDGFGPWQGVIDWVANPNADLAIR